MKLTIPYPPSINHYYRRVGARTLISRKGREYRGAICGLLAGRNKPPRDGRIALCMDAFPPDRRRRDLDNIQKPVLDALQHAEIYLDDSQVDLLVTRRCDLRRNGSLTVTIDDLPLRRCPLCGSDLPGGSN